VSALSAVRRLLIVALTCLALPPGDSSLLARAAAAQRLAIDDIYAAYVSGDAEVVRRAFAGSLAMQQRLLLREPRELERWLGSWDRRKALFVLELARVAADIGPQFLGTFSRIGRAYVRLARDPGDSGGETAAFVQTWHRAMVGMLQGSGFIVQLNEHVASLGGADPKLVLSAAIAHERRCWDARPSLDQPSPRLDAVAKAAGMKVDVDSDAPRHAQLKARTSAHLACLEVALARLQSAAQNDETGVEARVRSGWVLFQIGRFPEALKALDVVVPPDDRDLAYWQALFRGRTLAALNRHEDAAAAYRAALAFYPHAQSAGIGHAVELLRADRDAEADAAARALREAQSAAPDDPWPRYLDGDRRFVDRWMADLRSLVR
jgi:tetratricopeptide (TPR) repeat protein